MCVACQEFTIAPRQGVAYCLTSLAGPCSDNPPALVQRWLRRTLVQRCQRSVMSIKLGHAGASRHSWRYELWCRRRSQILEDTVEPCITCPGLPPWSSRA